MYRSLALTLAALALVATAGPSPAAVISWNTWTSDSTGTLTVGSDTIDVTFTTQNFHQNIPNYPSWTPTTT